MEMKSLTYLHNYNHHDVFSDYHLCEMVSTFPAYNLIANLQAELINFTLNPLNCADETSTKQQQAHYVNMLILIKAECLMKRQLFTVFH